MRKRKKLSLFFLGTSILFSWYSYILNVFFDIHLKVDIVYAAQSRHATFRIGAGDFAWGILGDWSKSASGDGSYILDRTYDVTNSVFMNVSLRRFGAYAVQNELFVMPAWLLGAFFLIAFLFLIRSVFARKNHCAVCGYLLVNIESDLCPECGWAIRNDRARMLLIKILAMLFVIFMGAFFLALISNSFFGADFMGDIWDE